MQFGRMSTAVLIVWAVTASASAQDLEDGFFSCVIGSFTLGDIGISNGNYAGPAFDRAFEAWYPFSVDGPTINWGGPLGGISRAGQIVSTVMKEDNDGQLGFDITIQNKDSGNFQTVTCYRAE